MTKLRVLLAVALALALGPAAAFAQTGTVRGRVVEQGSGSPLAGVTVSVVGAAQTVVTNQEGRFALTAVAQGQRTLRAARIGFAAASQTVTVGAEAVEVTFTLGADVLGLDEIVVIGYGQTERRNAPGAVASIRAAEVAQDLPAPSVNDVLQGRMAGVQVQQNSGTPGAAISVRVRGASSISAGNSPLYVVDGVPMLQGDYSTFDVGGQSVDALSDLNPNEIESIEVLKDASAAAIYGSRASNGVVLITTRRGRASERPEIQFNTWYGQQQAWRVPEYTNAAEYLELYQEAWNNAGYDAFSDNLFTYRSENFGEEYDLSGATDVDWLDQVMKPAGMSSVFGSIAGGTERARYFVSGSRLLQEGIVDPQGYQRLNGRLNLDYAVNDNITLGTSVGLTQAQHDRAESDNSVASPFANAIASAPIEAVYNEDGTFHAGNLYYNAVHIRDNQVQDRSFRVLGNAFVNFRLNDWLSARLNGGVDQYSVRSYLYYSPEVGPGVPTGTGSTGNSYATKVLTEGTLSWNRDVGASSLFSGVLGASYEDNDSEFSQVVGSGFATPDLKYLSSAAVISGGADAPSEYNLASVFGRASYTWNDQVTGTLNFRADGSSRFGANNRWGIFPSAALQYRPDLAAIVPSAGWLSDLAFRASYGLTGNQEGLGNFASLGLYSGSAFYGDRGGIAASQLPNPDLSWEKTTQLNLGADVAFLDDRLGLSFDWYRKNTTDLLLSRPLPRSTGYAGVTENIGAMTNSGVELALRAQLARGAERDGFNWTSEFNVSTNRNEVTKLYGGQPIPLSFESSVRIEEGQPLGIFYGYRADGLFRDQAELCLTATDEDGDAVETGAERNARCAAAGLAFQSSGTTLGDVRFVDVNGDGRISSDDRTRIGTPWPEFQGGWTNNLSFRGVDLLAFFQFSQGNDVFNGMRFYSDNPGFSGDNMRSYVLDRYSAENPDGQHPRVTIADPNSNGRASSRMVEDGSYVRLKNVVLGYTLPREFASRMGFRRLRVYGQGQNLMTWTDYTGFDPEVNFAGDNNVTRGYDFYTLPQSRTISIGLDVGL